MTEAEAVHAAQTSVIICAYTEARWDELLEAIASVQRQRIRPSEIIVVIDHNPTLLARLEAEALSAITIIPNGEAQGLSGARNSGIARAQGAIIAFLDEDAGADVEWLGHLTAPYADPQVMGVGGAIEPQWLDGQPGWFPDEFNWVVGCSYRGMPSQATPVRNMIGCNMSLRRAVFDGVGGFRSGIGRVGTNPVGCEETELCIRAQQRWPGQWFLYEPLARVRHRVPATRGTWSYFRARCYAEGRSKAQVTHFVGTSDGLSSERSYTMRTLPQGMVQGIAAGLRGDRAGLARAATIVAGLAITTAGYLKGSFLKGPQSRKGHGQTS